MGGLGDRASAVKGNAEWAAVIDDGRALQAGGMATAGKEKATGSSRERGRTTGTFRSGDRMALCRYSLQGGGNTSHLCMIRYELPCGERMG